MSLEFLNVDGRASSGRSPPLARSPMERQAVAAGGQLERRDGWSVAVRYEGLGEELDRCRNAVGWADVSQLGKLEIQGSEEDLRAICGERLELGSATESDGARWCPLTPERALVIVEPASHPSLRERLVQAAAASAHPVTVVDVTTVLAAMMLVGPKAREAFARFCAIDLRPSLTPILGLRPGSIARQPGIILREDEDLFLFLFGWAIAGYIWTVVDDAARPLGGGPVGLDALTTCANPGTVASHV